MKKILGYDWLMVFFLTLFPLVGIFGTVFYAYYNGIEWFEPILLVVFWFISGMGVTMGYHRLFAHKSYETNVFLEWVLMIFGSIALENTILKWASDHRKHHSLSDTEHDPYSITQGFWHAHIGWILQKTDKEKITGVKDLEKKSAVKFQKKYYYHIAVVGGVLVPLLVGFMYNRPLGGLLWGTFLRVTLVHHATFFINSLCHYTGERTYDVSSSARDSWIVSLFTFGEGYHNYHHKFPSDFRNGIRWFAFDPSKWAISLLSFFRLTKKLKRTKDSLVFKTRFENIHRILLKKLGNVNDTNIMYKNKIDRLFDIGNEVLSNWYNIEMRLENTLSNVDRESLKVYRRKVESIFKDLNIISKELTVVSS